MTEKKTEWKTYDAVLKWAKVLPDQMEEGGPQNSATKTIKKREGMWSLEMHVTDATKQRMIRDGVPEEALGYNMFKPADDFDGYPWAYRAKRYVLTGMKDENGKPIKNGPPIIADLNNLYEDDEGRKHATVWNPEEQGELGNGTVAKVTLSIYKGDEDQRIVTLQKVGVVEHIAYEGSEFVMY